MVAAWDMHVRSGILEPPRPEMDHCGIRTFPWQGPLLQQCRLGIPASSASARSCGLIGDAAGPPVPPVALEPSIACVSICPRPWPLYAVYVGHGPTRGGHNLLLWGRLLLLDLAVSAALIRNLYYMQAVVRISTRGWRPYAISDYFATVKQKFAMLITLLN